MLTRELAERCRHLVAVELDEHLFVGLRHEFHGVPHVTLLHRDFLHFKLPETPYKVFGSIPFSRTAAIIRRLVEAPVPPEDAYCVVQREAGERFAGGPFAPETLPSLLLKPWWQAEVARQLRRTDFDPPPRVDTVLLWLARRPRPLVDPSQQSLYHDCVISPSWGDCQAMFRRDLYGAPNRTPGHRPEVRRDRNSLCA